MKLSDLIDFNPKRRLEKGSVAPFIEMADLSEGERDVAQIGSRVFSGGGSKFTNGDTLFARITPCLENGKTAKVCGLPNERIGHGSTEFIVMSAKDKEHDEDFVYYLARHPEFRSFAKGRMEGTSGRQRVSWQALASYEVAEIDKTTRRQIGGVLASLDNRIAANRRVNVTLEEMARTMFKDWFVEFGPVRKKMEGQQPIGLAPDIAALFPDMLDEDGLPVGWVMKPLSHFIELIGGGTPKTSMPSYWNGDIPWFSVVDAPNPSDVFVVKTQKSITQLGLDNSSARLLPEGATIISARGTVGKLAMVGRAMAMNQSCYAAAGINGWGGNFVYFMLKNAVQGLQANTHGSVFDTITRSTFDSVSSVSPAQSVSQAFEAVVKPWMAQVRANLLEAETLVAIRDRLLPKLMSGEIRVMDAEQTIGDTK